jgi:hypothetical protein
VVQIFLEFKNVVSCVLFETHLKVLSGNSKYPFTIDAGFQVIFHNIEDQPSADATTL